LIIIIDYKDVTLQDWASSNKSNKQFNSPPDLNKQKRLSYTPYFWILYESGLTSTFTSEFKKPA
jgi:hypothetical protein